MYDELLKASQELLDEIERWEVPQVGNDGVYGPDTAVGRLQAAVIAINRDN